MNLDALFTLQFVMFAEMAAGYALCRLNVLRPENRSVLSKLVVNILLPANIIKSFDVEMNAEILMKFIQIFLASCGILVFTWLIARFAYNRLDKGKKAVLQYATVCSNAGFLGNAVAHGVYGDAGMMYGQIYLIPLRIVIWTAGVSYFAKSESKGNVLKTVLLHPCIIAVEIGLLRMIFSIPVPAPVTSVLSGLGGCSTPLIMLFLGMILAEVGFKNLFTPLNALFALIRLILIPAAVFAVCAAVHLDPMITGLSVLLAAMPAGSTTAVLAEQYHSDVEFAANTVVLTTMLSIALLPVWVYVLNAIL